MGSRSWIGAISDGKISQIPSQQLQKINDKYISYTSIQETMFCDLFRFHEQYFEYFCSK